MFPITEKYIEREYTIGSNYLMITSEHTVNEIEIAKQKRRRSNPPASQTVDKTLLVSTPEAFFLFSVQKVCT